MSSVLPPRTAQSRLASEVKHSIWDDVQAIFSGSLFVTISMLMYAQAGLLTGSTAGLAFLLHYATGWSFSTIYFVINLPFYGFAWRYIGREFTVKTFICVSFLSLATYFAPNYMNIDYLHPAFAAMIGGLLLGAGLLFLARHKSSLGGATIVSLYLQERFGIRAGKTQMLIDCIVLILSLWIVPPEKMMWSIIAAIVMGVFLLMKIGRAHV